MEAKDIKLTKLAKCAGCGAKVGAGILAQLLGDIRVRQDENLLVGFDKSDDASVYKVSDGLALVQTVDFFPPIADDPYTFGQIAATNALSDVYAMGGEPKLCLNIMAVPESMPKEDVHDILRGGYDKVYEAGALITGGHSIYDDEPKYGLAVTGFVHPDKVLTNSGAKPGDVLFFTKPLGIGILTTAEKADLLSEDGKALAGATIGLFLTDGTEPVLTTVSAEDGSFTFADIPYGEYVVREIAAPEGYVMDDTPYTVKVDQNGAVVEIEITNKLIRGSVQLTKVDLDETDGWMECESCHNAVQILEYAKSRRVPVYQMADCNLLVPLNKKR